VAVHRVGGLLMVEQSYSQMWVERVRLRHQTSTKLLLGICIPFILARHMHRCGLLQVYRQFEFESMEQRCTCMFPSLISRSCTGYHLQSAELGCKMSNAHCLAPHVAALVPQALKASHAHPLIFQVENLTLSL